MPAHGKLITRELTLRFLTPAFLGNAQQTAQWRTPPIKHLLRRWWRIAWSAEHKFPNDTDHLARREAELFGSAAGDHGHRSRLRIRLSSWEDGNLKQWPQESRVHHPEVGHAGKAVGAHLYLGYGPLQYDKASHRTRLDHPPAIAAGEGTTLKLAYPETQAPLIDRTLALIDRFAALGGRSRNGWGSVELQGAPTLDTLPLRPWRDCLDRTWIHAIGADDQDRALVWQTQPHQDWTHLMKTLAEIKIELRTAFPFTGKHHPRPERRHWLAYPVTHHPVRSWGNHRLPNSLCFKVCRHDQNTVVGLIIHLPHLPPRPDNRHAQPIPLKEVASTWAAVHQHLDDSADLERLPTR